MGITYKDSGVDIDASNAAKKRIRELARNTFTPGVLSDIGSFGGMFACDFGGLKNPVLVSSTDGVGTKLKIAVMMNRHTTVGADLVNHCVNDILVQGARPLFFMDYVATGRLDADVIVSVVEGVARGCKEAGCALIGGETAEMPGFYADGEYEVAGFIVGIVDRSRILDGKSIRHGDLLIGLPSVGLHTNGYSLARKVFFELAKLTPNSRVDGLEGTVGDELLKPHVNYEPIVRVALARNLVERLAHITGGGITENLNRILPDNCQAEVRPGSWPVLPLCQLMARLGGIERDEMLRSTNMGIGMVIVVRPSNLAALTATLSTPWYQIGQIIPGEPRVTYRS
ncbi:MAG: phosphoribosylformylglycinamidine cyclo-ligase [Acidobacteria bacterium]|nr:MAG: phosphoribosylformylglycinamidine cyclo-ligase [Acidobacteriota bacterium]